jgi:16S rRNA (uracil1498-N3)-methyltransferase
MSTTYFYHAQATLHGAVEFDSSEATHITKALRLKSNDRIQLTNGCGGLYTAQILVDKHRVSALVLDELPSSDSIVPLHIGIAPTKNADRIEWLVEKAVELGVGEISFLNCAHSERSRISMDRIHRVAIAALKQSRRTFLPKINESMDFLDWLKGVDSEQRFIAHCMDNLPRKLLRDSIQLNTLNAHSSVCIAIGPEGDFSETEVQAAMAVSFQPVSLGSARLRTETAALVAIHTYNLMHQI